MKDNRRYYTLPAYDEDGVKKKVTFSSAKSINKQLVPSEQVWDERHHATLRFVAEDQNRVIGWIAISPVSTRAVYSGVGEVSVYISSDSKGKGIASKLFKILIEESVKAGFWTLQPSIFAINTSSIQLHKKMGLE